MWGSCLDHVVEVEVVTSDGVIQRANDTVNSDLFWVRHQILLCIQLFSVLTTLYRL
jgi:hypothetical protein